MGRYNDKRRHNRQWANQTAIESPPESPRKLVETQASAEKGLVELEKLHQPVLSAFGLRLPKIDELLRTAIGHLDRRWDEAHVVACMEQVVLKPVGRMLERLGELDRDLQESNQTAIAAAYKESVSEDASTLDRLLTVYRGEYDLMVTLANKCQELVGIVARELAQIKRLVENVQEMEQGQNQREARLSANLRELTREAREMSNQVRCYSLLHEVETQTRTLEQYQGKLVELRRQHTEQGGRLHGHQQELASQMGALRKQKRRIDDHNTIFNLASVDLYTLLNVRAQEVPTVQEDWQTVSEKVGEVLPKGTVNIAPLLARARATREQVLRQLDQLTAPAAAPTPPARVAPPLPAPTPAPSLELEPAEFALVVYAAICATNRAGTVSHPKSGRTVKTVLSKLLVPNNLDQGWTESQFEQAVTVAEDQGWLRHFLPREGAKHICWQPTPSGLQEVKDLWPRCPDHFRQTLAEANTRLKASQKSFRDKIKPREKRKKS